MLGSIQSAVRSDFAETFREKNARHSRPKKSFIASKESYPFIKFYMCYIQCNFKYASPPNLHFRKYIVRQIYARRPFALATSGGTLHTSLSTNAPHTASVRRTVASD